MECQLDGQRQQQQRYERESFRPGLGSFRAIKSRYAVSVRPTLNARSRNLSRKGKQFSRDVLDLIHRAGRTIRAGTKSLEMIENEENVIGFDALYESMRKCRKGVMWKGSVASFTLNGIERVMNLSDDLKKGKYRAKPPVQFRITSPKPREIASVCFRDRVYQRSLNDNAIYPVMTKSFIYDNWACQNEKGTDGARERLKEFLRRYYRRYGNAGFVAQFDIHGYYRNMGHASTEMMFQAKLPYSTYRRAERILREQYPGDIGYNPGSQLIQIAGISSLDDFDHFVKEKLHAEFYIRYMDDFIILSDDEDFLRSGVESIRNYLEKLHFELNPDKTRIYPLDEGILFLGFRFRLTDTGRVYLQIDPANVKRERRKLTRLVKRSKAGQIPKSAVDDSFKAWKNHAEKGNSFKLIRRMEKYYKELWRSNNGTSGEKQNGFTRKSTV